MIPAWVPLGGISIILTATIVGIPLIIHAQRRKRRIVAGQDKPTPSEIDFGSPEQVIAGLDRINAHNARQWCNKCGFQPCTCFKGPTRAGEPK